MKPVVIYLTYDGLADPLGQSQILPYLIGLANSDIPIHIVSFEKKSNIHRLKKIESQLTKTLITWKYFFYTKTPPVASTLYDLYRLNRYSNRCVKKWKIKIIHCRSYLTALVGLRIVTKNPNLKFIFDIRGFWADERVDGGLWDLKSRLYRLIYRYFKRNEISLFERADHIISLTHLGKSIIESGKLFNHNLVEDSSLTNLKINSENITVIPCCVDTELFDPKKIKEQDRVQLKEQLGIGLGDKVLSYVGSIGTWYLLDEMLYFFKRFSYLNPSWKFLFISGEDPKTILDKADRLGITSENIIIQSVERYLVPLYLSISNYSIFFIKPLFSKSASSPTKQGEIMAMQVPVICNSGIGDTTWLVEQYSSGVILDLEQVNSCDLDHLQQIVWNASGIREGAIEYFSLQKGIESYLKIYKSLGI